MKLIVYSMIAMFTAGCIMGILMDCILHRKELQ
jgi:hypothetical protein